VVWRSISCLASCTISGSILILGGIAEYRSGIVDVALLIERMSDKTARYRTQRNRAFSLSDDNAGPGDSSGLADGFAQQRVRQARGPRTESTVHNGGTHLIVVIPCPER
jgi:hypothetical protein